MVTVFGKRIRLFRPRTIWIRKSRSMVLLFADRIHRGQSHACSKRSRDSLPVERITACSLSIWRRGDALHIGSKRTARQEDPRLFARSRRHRSGTLLLVWSSLLRMGLPVGHSAGMGWQDSVKKYLNENTTTLSLRGSITSCAICGM